MMMPANFSAVAENEMTYVVGGSLVDVLAPAMTTANWQNVSANVIKIVGNSFLAKYTNDELLEAFGEMTLVELSEFVKAFEEKFDVEAAAPAAVAVAAPGAAAPAEEEKDEFDVILSAVGDKKIQVIKAVRAITSLGLRPSTER